MATETIIRGQHLNRTFGTGENQTRALRDVSLELHSGQLALLVGPSGSGKSTLLAVLSGLLRPDSGEVLALGEDLWRLPDSGRERFRLRHMGFVFQGYHLFPMLTAREHLELVLRWGCRLSPRETQQRTSAMLDMLGLARKGDLYPEDLSGGEKQRVAIGRALVKEPICCFADEPTSSLDWGHGEQVIQLLCHAAHRSGAMVLVVAHDSRLFPYADVIYHLEDGQLREGSTPRGNL